MFKKVNIYYFLIAATVFVYVAIRAFTVGITYDEAYTLNQIIPGTYLDIITFKRIDANNHLLNTLLIKTLFTFFKKKLVIARIPNVIAFAVFLIYCYKITSKNITGVVGLFIFMVLIANPFMLDFFSLARGYGLALCFEVLSLYQLIHFFNHYYLKTAYLSILFSALAVLCNFTMLNYFIVSIGVLNVIPLLLKNNIQFRKTLLFTAVISTLLFIIITNPIKLLLQNNCFYYGGNSNVYSDTLVSLTKYSCYTMQETTTTHIILISLLLIFSTLLCVSYYITKKIITVKTIVLSILLLSITSTIIQHYTLGNLYLIDRTALFLYPLFIFVLGFSFAELAYFKTSKIILTFVTIAFTSNLLIHANFYKTVTWFFDARTEEILTYLNKKGKIMNKTVKMYYSWPVESSMAYYFTSLKYPYVENCKEKLENFNYETDYYVFCNQSIDKILYKIENQSAIINLKKDTLLKFENENLYVFHHLK